MEHSLIKAALDGPVVPGFYQLLFSCSCGQTHYMLLTADEVDIGIKVMSELRDLRKRQDETVFQEDFIQTGPEASLDLGS